QIGGSMNLKGIGQTGPDGGPFGGVIGYDFLSRFPMLIDYQSHALTVFNPDHFTAPDGGKEIPFHLTMQVPTVAGELVGDTGSFIVDLGNAFGLIVHQRFAEQNELGKKLLDVHESAGVLGGVGGGVLGKSGFATEFHFGSAVVDSLRVMMPASSEGLAGSEELAGNIGNGILQRFRPLFDYHHQRIILYPIEKTAEQKTP
ncbi:MAG TPA: hypothetical protein VMS71_01755, partial [Candidatus Acidoferrum sp.]|nr:hypothetical protein [Candidatus Acidoferrum sp.]